MRVLNQRHNLTKQKCDSSDTAVKHLKMINKAIFTSNKAVVIVLP